MLEDIVADIGIRQGSAPCLYVDLYNHGRVYLEGYQHLFPTTFLSKQEVRTREYIMRQIFEEKGYKEGVDFQFKSWYDIHNNPHQNVLQLKTQLDAKKTIPQLSQLFHTQNTLQYARWTLAMPGVKMQLLPETSDILGQLHKLNAVYETFSSHLVDSLGEKANLYSRTEHILQKKAAGIQVSVPSYINKETFESLLSEQMSLNKKQVLFEKQLHDFDPSAYMRKQESLRTFDITFKRTDIMNRAGYMTSNDLRNSTICFIDCEVPLFKPDDVVLTEKTSHLYSSDVTHFGLLFLKNGIETSYIVTNMNPFEDGMDERIQGAKVIVTDNVVKETSSIIKRHNPLMYVAHNAPFDLKKPAETGDYTIGHGNTQPYYRSSSTQIKKIKRYPLIDEGITDAYVAEKRASMLRRVGVRGAMVIDFLPISKEAYPHLQNHKLDTVLKMRTGATFKNLSYASMREKALDYLENDNKQSAYDIAKYQIEDVIALKDLHKTPVYDLNVFLTIAQARYDDLPHITHSLDAIDVVERKFFNEHHTFRQALFPAIPDKKKVMYTSLADSVLEQLGYHKLKKHDSMDDQQMYVPLAESLKDHLSVAYPSFKSSYDEYFKSTHPEERFVLAQSLDGYLKELVVDYGRILYAQKHAHFDLEIERRRFFAKHKVSVETFQEHVRSVFSHQKELLL